MHYETARLHAPRCLEKFRTAVCVSVCVREKKWLQEAAKTHSGRVRVRHHSWDSGKHQYPQHGALLPVHSWKEMRYRVRASPLQRFIQFLNCQEKKTRHHKILPKHIQSIYYNNVCM